MFRRTLPAMLAVFMLAGAPSLASAQEAMATGTVTKVDKAAGKITIDHGPLESLDMPAMKMVFRAGDEAMLDQVKEGDEIRFTAERVRGQLTVTEIEK